jgi:hypothetical protein
MFLFESDIQSALFGELRKNVPEKMKEAGSRGNVYELSLICSDYGQHGMGSDKVDIVCLDAKQISHFKGTPYKGFDVYIYHLPVLSGIELKYF